MRDGFSAVVTGDVNASRKLNRFQLPKLEEVLQQCYEKMASAFSPAKVRGFSVFRGDSWQFAAMNPEQVLRCVLYFKAILIHESALMLDRKIHTSAAIGFGSIDFLPDDQNSSGGGDAYVLSGERVDEIRRRIPGMGVAGLENLNANVDVTIGLIDVLTRRWTASQALAVSMALCGLNQHEIAERWYPRKITQQAVQKHLQGAGYPAIEPAVTWFETTMRGCKNKYNHKRL